MAGKAAVWRERLAAWRAGELSAAAFCRQHGLAYATFGYWQRKLRVPGAGLIPVQIDTPSAQSAAAALSLALTLSNGVVLQVRGATTADIVALVRALTC